MHKKDFVYEKINAVKTSKAQNKVFDFLSSRFQKIQELY